MLLEEIENRLLELEVFVKKIAKWTDFNETDQFKDSPKRRKIATKTKSNPEAKSYSQSLPENDAVEINEFEEFQVKIEPEDEEIQIDDVGDPLGNSDDCNTERDDPPFIIDSDGENDPSNDYKSGKDKEPEKDEKKKAEIQREMKRMRKYKPLLVPSTPNEELSPIVVMDRLTKEQLHEMGITKTSVARRNKSNFEPQNKCDYCERTFVRKVYLIRHRSEQHGNEDGFVQMKLNYPCPRCPKVFNTAAQRFTHMDAHIVHSKIRIKRHSVKKSRRFKCEYCENMFLKKFFLIKHRSEQHGNEDGFVQMKLNYPCPSCPKVFNTAGARSTHMDVHREDKPFICTLCNYRTNARRYLRVHFKHKHPGAKLQILVDKSTPEPKSEQQVHKEVSQELVNCAKVSARVDPSHLDARRARRQIEPDGNSCDYCDKSFVRRSHLMKHRSEQHGNEDGFVQMELNYPCPNCPKVFKNSSQRSAHMNVHREDKPFLCHLCEYRTNARRYLRQHLKHRHPGVKLRKLVDNNKNKSGSTETEVEKEDGQMESYPCPQCPKVFRLPVHRTSHMNVHMEGKPFLCNLCNYKTKARSYLRIHFKRRHPNAKLQKIPTTSKTQISENKDATKVKVPIRTGTYIRKKFVMQGKSCICHICGKKMFSIYSVQKHIAAVHEFRKPLMKYSCSLCPLKTDSPSHLAIHTRTHTGERPFACDLCDYSGNTNVLLQNHIMRVHSLKEKTVECNECGRKFKHNGGLQQHKRKCHSENSKTKWPCGKCTTNFNDQEKLLRHIETFHESGEELKKDVKCHHCPKLFRDQYKLKAHLESVSRTPYWKQRHEEIIRKWKEKQNENPSAEETPENQDIITEQEQNEEMAQPMAISNDIVVEEMPNCDSLVLIT